MAHYDGSVETLNTLRRHLLEDVRELVQVVMLVNPLACNASIEADDIRVLRRVLTRLTILIIVRIYERESKGKTGLTASIPSIIFAASQAMILESHEANYFQEKFSELQTDLERDGVTYPSLVHYRDSELAHSLHPHLPNDSVIPWYSIYKYSNDTFAIAKQLDGILVDRGCEPLDLLPDNLLTEWTSYGEKLSDRLTSTA
jgi:hypothetical protein